MTRYGSSKAAAERALRVALRDRTGPAGEEITAETRVRVIAKLWRAEVEVSELAAGSKEVYERTLDGHVLPALGELLVREVTVSAVDRFLRAVRHWDAVRRSVVDLDAGILEVNATVVRLRGKGAVLQPRTKTDAGWRVIALPDHVVELCRQGMSVSWPRNELGLLFPTAVGSVRNPSNVQGGLRPC